MSTKHAEYVRNYRLTHPEYREIEKAKDREYTNNRYKNDEEYRKKTIDNAKARYIRLKELKKSQVNTEDND